MKWEQCEILRDDYEATGEVGGGIYRAWVGYGVMPDAWKSKVQWWPGGFYYVAFNGTLTDVVMAQLWAEAAMLQLQRIAERLGEVKA